MQLKGYFRDSYMYNQDESYVIIFIDFHLRRQDTQGYVVMRLYHNVLNMEECELLSLWR